MEARSAKGSENAQSLDISQEANRKYDNLETSGS